MINKYIKASLLVLLMASSVSLTSCKKKDDPKPNTELLEKEAKEKAEKEKEAEKARIEKEVVGKWLNPVPFINEEEPSDGEVVFYDFKGDAVDMYVFSSDKIKVNTIVGTYKVSDDGKQIVITSEGNDKTINITIAGKVLTVDNTVFITTKKNPFADPA